MLKKYLKVRVTADEFAEIYLAADAAGMTLSAYIRSALAQRRQSITVDAALSRIEQQLAKSSGDTSMSMEPLLVEVLLLARELAADRNAQILARVNQQLNTKFPAWSKTA